MFFYVPVILFHLSRIFFYYGSQTYSVVFKYFPASSTGNGHSKIGHQTLPWPNALLNKPVGVRTQQWFWWPFKTLNEVFQLKFETLRVKIISRNHEIYVHDSISQVCLQGLAQFNSSFRKYLEQVFICMSFDTLSFQGNFKKHTSSLSGQNQY